MRACGLSVVLLVVLLGQVYAAPPKSKPIHCGTSGLIWAKTFNFDNEEENYLVAVDAASLKVVFNWTWVNAMAYLDSAYDITTGTLVFYSGQVLQTYNTITRTFGDNQVPLSLDNPLDFFFDNQGQLWALYFDPKNDKQYLFCTVDLGTGGVDPLWTAPNAANGIIDGDGAFDFVNNVYYFQDGGTPNTLMAMNLNTGKFSETHPLEIDSPAFVNGANQLIGELNSNNSLAVLDVATGKMQIVYPNPPSLVSQYVQVFDKRTNSYIIQVLNDDTEVYYWWALQLDTLKTRQANSAQAFLGAHLCPYTL